MLVLARRKGQRIIIDGRITITVLGLKGSSVRLGVEAPKEIPIQREEVHRQILAEGSSASEPQAA